MSMQWIMGLGALLIFVILIIIFRKRKWILFLIFALAGLGAWYGYREYTRTNKDLANVKADVKISATDLLYEYETADSTANQKYLGKVLEVSGYMKKLEKDEAGLYTIVLGDTASLSSVRCAVDSVHGIDAKELVTESIVAIRGACTGFNKDDMGLGSDVILNRCAIISNKK